MAGKDSDEQKNDAKITYRIRLNIFEDVIFAYNLLPPLFPKLHRNFKWTNLKMWQISLTCLHNVLAFHHSCNSFCEWLPPNSPIQLEEKHFTLIGCLYSQELSAEYFVQHYFHISTSAWHNFPGEFNLNMNNVMSDWRKYKLPTNLETTIVSVYVWSLWSPACITVLMQVKHSHRSKSVTLKIPSSPERDLMYYLSQQCRTY